MSCKKCDELQNGEVDPLAEAGVEQGVVRMKQDGTAYYRWKNANIQMQGCDKHLREVFDALNEVQKNGTKNQP